MKKRLVINLFCLLLPSLGFPDGLLPDGRPVSDTGEVEYQQALRILRNPKSGEIPLYAEDHSAEAVQLLRAASDRGHRRATFHLGSLYLGGQGVEQSIGRAFSCYLKAGGWFLMETLFAPVIFVLLLLIVIWSGIKFRSILSAGYSGLLALRVGRGGGAVLEYKLGMRYFRGKGSARRLTDARHLFEKSAEQNYAPAQIQMGRFYKEGTLVQANRLKAAEWFQKAASQGHAEGLFLVGGCYERGEGVPLNVAKALGFYQLAAAYGHAEANVSAEQCSRKITERQKQDAHRFAGAYVEENELTGSG